MTKSSLRYIYETPWSAYAFAWAARPLGPRFRFAVGSLCDRGRNCLQVLELNEGTNRIELVAEVEHACPASKLLWRPSADAAASISKDCFASSGTTLNLWQLEDGQVHSLAKLSSSGAGRQDLAPLTSFDWSTASEHNICAASVDTTITIWDIEHQRKEHQLIGHDKPIYDIAFSKVAHLFASVGADGSLRMFDERDLQTSTILYETGLTPASPSPAPLLRLAWNAHNTNLIAVVTLDKTSVSVVDIRRAGVALQELSSGDAHAHTLAWAPHSRNHLLCGADNGCAMVWDISRAQASPAYDEPLDAGLGSNSLDKHTPVLSYECDHEIYQVQWPVSQPDCIALGTASHFQVFEV